MIRGVAVVITDDLSAPLGQQKSARSSRKLTLAQLHLIAGVLALSLVVGTGWMFLADQPITNFGSTGSIGATAYGPSNDRAADIRLIRLSPEDGTTAPNDLKPAPAPETTATRTITIIDGTSGRRQEVQIPAAEHVPDTERPEPKQASTGQRSPNERTRPADVSARRPNTDTR